MRKLVTITLSILSFSLMANETFKVIDGSTVVRTLKDSVLVEATTLPYGTVLTYSENVGRKYYQLSDGSKKMSVTDYVTGLSIVSSPKEIENFDGSKLYVSLGALRSTAPTAVSDLGSRVSCFDELTRQGVSSKALEKALEAQEKHASKIQVKKYIAVSDYGLGATKKRFWFIDLEECQVISEEKVASAINGYYCGKGNETNAVRAGATLIREFHWRNHNTNKNGRIYKTWPNITKAKVGGAQQMSLKLIGLEKSTKNVLGRGVVAHESKLNYTMGDLYKSAGCIVLPNKLLQGKVVDRKGSKKRWARDFDYNAGWYKLQSMAVRGVMHYSYVPSWKCK